MTSILSQEDQTKLRTALAGCDINADVIEQTLTDDVFGPGVMGMQADQNLGYGVGILVDETRDPELATLFDRRRQTLDDQTFLADWEPALARVRALLCPHAPEALLAYSIGLERLERPWPLRRTFLLFVSIQSPRARAPPAPRHLRRR